MTDEERKEEGAEEAIEDLEAPAAAQDDVAGGLGPCKPTNACKAVNTLVHTCSTPTQLCVEPTCRTTSVMSPV